jgi:hypothetical protein
MLGKDGNEKGSNHGSIATPDRLAGGIKTNHASRAGRVHHYTWTPEIVVPADPVSQH